MATGTELAVGYVSLVAETSQLSRGINTALTQAGRNAENLGTQMGQRMGRGASNSMGRNFRPQAALSPGIAAAEQTGRQMGQRMGQQTATQFKQFLTTTGLMTSGLLGVGVAVGGAMTSAVKGGNQFQANLNRLQGASQATAEQMAQVSARAKELGSDVTLTGVSAQDAASAMTELVKGGFDVTQSMNAVRGSVQLATAAQVSAAEAATIQANALNAFQLQAQDASKVADVLANVANASTGEMTDFAYGLQMGGAVMNQFGVSIEDATATLGMLANAGIKGSDAGTLIKSMLLQLASPSDEAAGAINELGLKVWDATGNFVGMRSIMEQLQDASQRFTPEMYAMLTSTALGSDAARLAGVSAAQGGEGFDKMRVAVEQEGAAARLAQANNQGLPGVFERLSNTADRAKLALYELVKGPLSGAGDAINQGLNGALDNLEGGVDGPLGDLVNLGREAVPVFGDIAGAIGGVASVVGSTAWTGLETVLTAAVAAGDALLPLLGSAGQLVGDNAQLVGTLAAAWAFMHWVTPGLTRMNTALATQATRAQAAVGAVTNLATQQTRSMEISRTASVQMGRFGTALDNIGQHVPAITRMQTAFYQGAINAQTFGRTAGAARAAVSGLASAASGMVGVLGGPWAAALMAATVGITLIASSKGEEKQRTDALSESNARLSDSYDNLFVSLGKSGGQVNSDVIGKTTEQVDILSQRIETLRRGPGIGEWLSNTFTPENADPFAAFSKSFEKQGAAENAERMKKAMDDLGTTSQNMGVLVSGSAGAWDTWSARARAAGDGGVQLQQEMQKLRDEFLSSQAAAANLTPGIVALSEQIAVLGSNTATTEEKTNALKAALDILAGKQPDVAAAQKTYDDTMRATGEATQEAIDATKGFSAELMNADGSVNTATANGSKLYENLQRIKDATVQVAASGGDLQAAYRGNSAQFQLLATQMGLTEEQVRRMAEAMGLVPQRIDTLMSTNSEETTQDIVAVKSAMESLPPNTPVKIDALTEEAETKLEAVGFQVTRLPDNKGVEITATGVENANAKLQSIIDTMNNVPSRMVLEVAYQQLGQYDTGSFADAGAAQRERRGGSATPGGYLDYQPGREAGGPIRGAGPMGQDGIPIVAAPGEHMWTDEEVRGAGGHSAMQQLRDLARQGKLRGFEEGGKIRGDGYNKEWGPFGPYVEGVKPQYDPPGAPDTGRFNPNMQIDTSTTSLSPVLDPGHMTMNDLKKVITQKPNDMFNPVQQKRRDVRREDAMWQFISGGKDAGSSFFEKGGPIGYEEGGAIVDPRIAAIDAAYRNSGRPYEYGPWDCSMYMSTIYGAMSGAGPGRHFTTESDFEAMGFKKGYKPGALNIGIKRGGGGRNSHMAGTLPNGVNVENGGANGGSVYGPGAQGASDFPIQYYFEGETSGIDMVSNPTGQPNAARVPGQTSGQGAQGGFAAMTGITPKMTANDVGAGQSTGTAPTGAASGAAADLGLGSLPGAGDVRTEGLIPAGAGNGAPTGKGLIGGLAGMGVSVASGLIDAAAQAASMAASVAAAGAGAPGAGAPVGAGIQMGADVAKRGVQFGGEMIGIWGDALIEQVTPFGAPRWLNENYIGSFTPQIPGMGAQTTTLEEGAAAAKNQMATSGVGAAGGAAAGLTAPPMPAEGVHTGAGIPPGPVAPVTPPAGVGAVPNGATSLQGAQAAQSAMLDPFRMPIHVRDSGGVLPPNSMAANLSTESEMVLTQEQWDSVTAGAARMPLDPAAEALDFSTHIGSVQVSDVDAMKRELDSRSKLAMMRYAGRHK